MVFIPHDLGKYAKQLIAYCESRSYDVVSISTDGWLEALHAARATDIDLIVVARPEDVPAGRPRIEVAELTAARPDPAAISRRKRRPKPQPH